MTDSTVYILVSQGTGEAEFPENEELIINRSLMADFPYLYSFTHYEELKEGLGNSIPWLYKTARQFGIADR